MIETCYHHARMSMTGSAMLPHNLGGILERTIRWIGKPFSSTPTSLVSPAADALMAGGASIILYLFFRFGMPPSFEDGRYSLALFLTAFFANYPHFLASYGIFYGDLRKEMPRLNARPLYRARYLTVGWIIPLAMLAFIAVAYVRSSEFMMGALASAMYFLVGWHYVKQVFGCIIVLSATKKTFFTKIERRILLTALSPIWIIMYEKVNGSRVMNEYLGINYSLPRFPVPFMTAMNLILVTGAIAVTAMLVRKRIRERKTMPFSAFLALLSLYIWIVPPFRMAIFFLMVPFFHSLQYLLFASVYERNKCIAEVGTAMTERPAQRKRSANALNARITLFFLACPVLAAVLSVIAYGKLSVTQGFLETMIGTWAQNDPKNFYLFAGFSILFTGILFRIHRKMRNDPATQFTMNLIRSFELGVFLFIILPSLLDNFVTRMAPVVFAYDTELFHRSLFVYIITIFVNIHHYFIDSVIWRKENPLMAKYMHGNE